MEQHIGELIAHYGYFGIVIALAGGIVGLPIPDEFLLTFVGYNVSKGVMSGTAAFLSGLAGAMLGITLSYILGLKLGLPVLKKYGPKIRIKEHHIEKHIFYLKIWAISFNDWLFYTGRTSFNSIFCWGIKFDTLAFLFVRLRWCAHLDKCFYWAWLEVRREVALR